MKAHTGMSSVIDRIPEPVCGEIQTRKNDTKRRAPLAPFLFPYILSMFLDDLLSAMPQLFEALVFLRPRKHFTLICLLYVCWAGCAFASGNTVTGTSSA